jgi:hypothetical protein
VHRFDELTAFARYARRLPAFLRETITPGQARERIARQRALREESFLKLLEGGVYSNPRSPYRRLLEAAGAELGDVRNLIGERGLERALAALRDAGVYATLDEFKGRRPLERGGLSLQLDHSDFDNAMFGPDFWARTGGSSGAPRRVPLDLDLLEHDAAHEALFRSAFELWERPFALLKVKPPSTSGIGNALRQAKLGGRVDKWFNPYRPPRNPEALRYWLFTTYTSWAGHFSGAGIARPEHCPPDEVARVAQWLASRRREGRPAFVDAQAGLGVRVCRAAAASGLDISDTFFRFGGEPLTRAKADAVTATGSRVVSHYSMVETGRVAMPCPHGTAFDDTHFLADKLAVIQREKVVGSAEVRVGVLSYTTLLPFTPKIMINVESDDYAVFEERSCGCPWDEIGLSLHLRGIRSHEKLTSEGNHFLGSDLIALIDEVLPARFGGGPTDYQLVEEEIEGLPKVSVVVSPEVGDVAERDVVSAVIDFLRAKPANRLMADFWEQSETVRLVRREPHVTAAGKTPALHVERAT